MYSPEFRLLLLSCRFSGGDDHIDAAVQIIENENPGWDEFISGAAFHRLEPQALDLLLKLPRNFVPETVIVRLQERTRDNLVRQIRYVSEFFIVNGWLGSEGIKAIPFKGFWLGESAYGDIGARISSDIDLFIDVRDLERVKGIMTVNHYIGHEGIDRLTDEYVRREMAEYNFGRYEEGMRMTHIEFHWRSAMAFYRMDVSLDDLRTQITAGMLKGRKAEVFSPAANMLLAVMHHGGKECYWQLRQVMDIAHLLRRYPDLNWDWLLNQAQRFHVKSLLMLGIRLAHEVTGVPVPEVCSGSLTDNRLGRMAQGRVRLLAQPAARLVNYQDSVASWIFKIRSRDGAETKISLAGHTMRKVIAPRMVPERWRHHFFNRKIRRTTAD